MHNQGVNTSASGKMFDAILASIAATKATAHTALLETQADAPTVPSRAEASNQNTRSHKPSQSSISMQQTPRCEACRIRELPAAKLVSDTVLGIKK